MLINLAFFASVFAVFWSSSLFCWEVNGGHLLVITMHDHLWVISLGSVCILGQSLTGDRHILIKCEREPALSHCLQKGCLPQLIAGNACWGSYMYTLLGQKRRCERGRNEPNAGGKGQCSFIVFCKEHLFFKEADRNHLRIYFLPRWQGHFKIKTKAKGTLTPSSCILII